MVINTIFVVAPWLISGRGLSGKRNQMVPMQIAWPKNQLKAHVTDVQLPTSASFPACVSFHLGVF